MSPPPTPLSAPLTPGISDAFGGLGLGGLASPTVACGSPRESARRSSSTGRDSGTAQAASPWTVHVSQLPRILDYARAPRRVPAGEEGGAGGADQAEAADASRDARFLMHEHRVMCQRLGFFPPSVSVGLAGDAPHDDAGGGTAAGEMDETQFQRLSTDSNALGEFMQRLMKQQHAPPPSSARASAASARSNEPAHVRYPAYSDDAWTEYYYRRGRTFPIEARTVETHERVRAWRAEHGFDPDVEAQWLAILLRELHAPTPATGYANGTAALVPQGACTSSGRCVEWGHRCSRACLAPLATLAAMSVDGGGGNGGSSVVTDDGCGSDVSSCVGLDSVGGVQLIDSVEQIYGCVRSGLVHCCRGPASPCHPVYRVTRERELVCAWSGCVLPAIMSHDQKRQRSMGLQSQSRSRGDANDAYWTNGYDAKMFAPNAFITHDEMHRCLPPEEPTSTRQLEQRHASEVSTLRLPATSRRRMQHAARAPTTHAGASRQFDMEHRFHGTGGGGSSQGSSERVRVRARGRGGSGSGSPTGQRVVRAPIRTIDVASYSPTKHQAWIAALESELHRLRERCQAFHARLSAEPNEYASENDTETDDNDGHDHSGSEAGEQPQAGRCTTNSVTVRLPRLDTADKHECSRFASYLQQPQRVHALAERIVRMLSIVNSASHRQTLAVRVDALVCVALRLFACGGSVCIRADVGRRVPVSRDPSVQEPWVGVAQAALRLSDSEVEHVRELCGVTAHACRRA